jgi:NADH-quinone oxidoreductase subunit E
MTMRIERKAGAVLVETGMFAAMVAVVATVLMMVVFAKGLIGAAAIGGTVGVVVAVAMWLLMRGTLEPPRGPGNIPTKPAPSAAPAPTAAPAPQAKSPTKASSTAEAAPDASAGTAPATLSAARDGKPDDLKKIKGVGPKLEELLHSMGFYHFDQVAAWTADEVAWVDENLTGFKGRVSRDDWVSQAKSLAAEG